MSYPALLSSNPMTPPLSPVNTLFSGVPSVGDVLMLSQTAWRTGRAFSSGRRCAEIVPAEFIVVEAELNRLAKALKRLAENLVSECIESFIASAERAVQDGVGTILLSCRRTLEDLESITSMYQTTRKSTTSGGFSLERLWNQSLVENYETFIWTVDGGTIQDLHEFLRMHTASVSMLTSIVETLSVPGLETGITPVAEKIRELYQCHPHDLSAHVAEIRGLAQAVGYDIPSPTATSPPPTPSFPMTPNRVSSVNLSSGSFSASARTSSADRLSMIPAVPTHAQIAAVLNMQLPPKRVEMHLPSFKQEDSPRRIDSMNPESAPVSPMTEEPPPMPLIVPGSRPVHQLNRAEASITVPRSIEVQPHSPDTDSNHRKSSSGSEPSVPLVPSSNEDSKAINKTAKLSLYPKVEQVETKAKRSESTISQQSEFERSQFRNAVILCDVRGAHVEYTIPPRERESLARDNELETAMSSCRICLVREKKLYKDGSVVYSLGIWSFSDDMTVRLEQKIDERAEIIPFTSYFQANKVSITVPTEVTYHSTIAGAKPIKTIKTTWVNYYFEDEDGSHEFQNRLFGRTLKASFKTEKTLRIHEGFVGIVSHHEQMCAMENLRVWYEEETGGYLVLIHFSALFRQGYMKFYLNNVNCPILIKDESHKQLRIKGLRIPSSPTHTRGERNGSKKSITGAKIEFTSEADKSAFIDLVKEAQKGMHDIEEY